MCFFIGCSLKYYYNCLRWCRFKGDATDLEFVEKVARWLTNTQVQIKSEVADSNTQSQTIAQSLDKLECLIKSCEHQDPVSNEVRALITLQDFTVD